MERLDLGVDGLRIAVFEAGAGPYVMEERPEAVSAALTELLRR